MAITIVWPGVLVPYARGARTAQVEASCATVGQALGALRDRCPGIVDRVLTEQGALREHVNVFVGEENARWLGGLEAPVHDGDAIEIIAAVSGG